MQSVMSEKHLKIYFKKIFTLDRNSALSFGVSKRGKSLPKVYDNSQTNLLQTIINFVYQHEVFSSYPLSRSESTPKLKLLQK